MQRSQDVVRRKPSLLTCGCIYVNHVLRERRIERGLCRRNLGAFLQLCDEVLNHLIELIEVATGLILHVKFKTIRHAITGNHRRCEDEDLRILDQIARLQIEHTRNNG